MGQRKPSLNHVLFIVFSSEIRKSFHLKDMFEVTLIILIASSQGDVELLKKCVEARAAELLGVCCLVGFFLMSFKLIFFKIMINV